MREGDNSYKQEIKESRMHLLWIVCLLQLSQIVARRDEMLRYLGGCLLCVYPNEGCTQVSKVQSEDREECRLSSYVMCSVRLLLLLVLHG